MGTREIREASGLSSRLLERPVTAMKSGGLGEGSAISKSLLDLRSTLEDLDPSRRGNLFEPRKLLGLIPWGNRLEEYFREYQSAELHIRSILESLQRGQDEGQELLGAACHRAITRKSNSHYISERKPLHRIDLHLRFGICYPNFGILILSLYL
jgi:hypothetical protein